MKVYGPGRGYFLLWAAAALVLVAVNLNQKITTPLGNHTRLLGAGPTGVRQARGEARRDRARGGLGRRADEVGRQAARAACFDVEGRVVAINRVLGQKLLGAVGHGENRPRPSRPERLERVAHARPVDAVRGRRLAGRLLRPRDGRRLFGQLRGDPVAGARDLGPDEALAVLGVEVRVPGLDGEAPRRERISEVLRVVGGRAVAAELDRDAARRGGRPRRSPQSSAVRDADAAPAEEAKVAADRDVQLARDGERRRVPACLLYTSPSPRDATLSRMPSSA